MKTIEQLKDLEKELNNKYSHGVLKFKVMNNKHGTGIRWIGTWGRYGGYGFRTNNHPSGGSVRGLYQGFGRTDEEFVAEVKREVTEIIENLVKDYSKRVPSGLVRNKFDDVMEQYLKSN